MRVRLYATLDGPCTATVELGDRVLPEVIVHSLHVYTRPRQAMILHPEHEEISFVEVEAYWVP